jgi:DNA-binding transcriptional ArsR family regulator
MDSNIEMFDILFRLSRYSCLAMPWIDERPAPRPRIEVHPSATAELLWLQFMLEKHCPLPPEPALAALAPAADQLRMELAAMWPSTRDRRVAALTVLVVLAHRAGALLGEDPGPFLRGMEAVAAGDGPVELLSEKPEDRQRAIELLQRLREDPALLRRQRRVLARIWELARPEWEARGREAVATAVRTWRERLERASVLDVVGGNHILSRCPEVPETMQPLVELRPLTVLSPLHFAAKGGFVIDLTTYLHVGAPASSDELQRAEAERVADRLKVLSDGTRLAILRWLVSRPSSVMDLAHSFQLAQPTVSNHVRLLREAGLLKAERQGARTLYRASPERVEALLEEASRLVAG